MVLGVFDMRTRDFFADLKKHCREGAVVFVFVLRNVVLFCDGGGGAIS